MASFLAEGVGTSSSTAVPSGLVYTPIHDPDPNIYNPCDVHAINYEDNMPTLSAVDIFLHNERVVVCSAMSTWI